MWEFWSEADHSRCQRDVEVQSWSQVGVLQSWIRWGSPRGCLRRQLKANVDYYQLIVKCSQVYF
jgi:hypothetical protein